MVIERKIVDYPVPPAFGNVEYIMRISYTLSTDRRTMSFIDYLWGIEVTGGVDQYEPLTIISVRQGGLAHKAGIQVGDTIMKINNTQADKLTLMEAQQLIRKSGRSVRIMVQGDDNSESDFGGEDEYTVNYWFTPPITHAATSRFSIGKIPDVFPWNDRRKPIYKESNCYLVPSIYVERMKRSSANRTIIRSLEEKIAIQHSEINTRTEPSDIYYELEELPHSSRTA
uniref:Putative pdz domain-containing protein n=1 Tax=Nyssomyia neivai TaxID=330878 RepID=A0A1L8DW96_9DIPT